MADGIRDEVLSVLVHANDGEDLQGLSDVSQGLPPARLVEHAVEVSCERRCIACDEELPPRASAETRAATLIVVPK